MNIATTIRALGGLLWSKRHQIAQTMRMAYVTLKSIQFGCVSLSLSAGLTPWGRLKLRALRLAAFVLRSKPVFDAEFLRRVDPATAEALLDLEVAVRTDGSLNNV